MILIGSTTVGLSIIYKKAMPGSRYIRNSILSFFGLGVVVAADIFNPFIYKWFNF